MLSPEAFLPVHKDFVTACRKHLLENKINLVFFDEHTDVFRRIVRADVIYIYCAFVLAEAVARNFHKHIVRAVRHFVIRKGKRFVGSNIKQKFTVDKHFAPFCVFAFDN